MKNLVEFKNFIEPLIEEFEKSDFFQQLNAKTQRNATLFISDFAKHLGNLVPNSVHFTTWQGSNILNAYQLSYLAFNWIELFEKEKDDLYLPYIDQVYDSIVAFLQFWSSQKQEIPVILDGIGLINENYNTYKNDNIVPSVINFMISVYHKAQTNGINIYDEVKIDELATKELEEMKTIDKYEKLADKFGAAKALDMLNPKEEKIVMSHIIEANELGEEDIDIALGKKLQAQILMMQVRGDSDAKVEQFIKNLPDFESNSLFYVIQEEMERNSKLTNNRPVSVGPKIGRNDPCSCGSGKKYKKCCG